MAPKACLKGCAFNRRRPHPPHLLAARRVVLHLPDAGPGQRGLPVLRAEMIPGLLFDRASIAAFAPARQAVVYRIFRRHELLYVGATARPAARLLEHLNDYRFVVATHVTLEKFRNTTAMARSEREAMASENPIYPSVPRRHQAWKAQNR